MTLPGPGDPATWGAPTGHPNDPRTEDVYGPCDTCDQETGQVLDAGVDADEDGTYGWIVFRCEECEQLIAEMGDEPEEVAKTHRALEEEVDALMRAGKQVIDTWESGHLAEAVNLLQATIEDTERSQGRRA